MESWFPAASMKMLITAATPKDSASVRGRSGIPKSPQTRAIMPISSAMKNSALRFLPIMTRANGMGARK